MKCPDCENGVRIASHVSFSDGTRGYGVPLKCTRCDGTAVVSGEMADWIARGRLLKEKRLNPYRTLHQEARRRGISAMTLSDMELGKIEPIEDLS